MHLQRNTEKLSNNMQYFIFQKSSLAFLSSLDASTSGKVLLYSSNCLQYCSLTDGK